MLRKPTLLASLKLWRSGRKRDMRKQKNMLQSKIKEILEEEIRGIEELKDMNKDKFHAIEREIDDNKRVVPCYNLNIIIQRAEELIVRVFDAFQGNSLWINSKWSGIERKIKKNLKKLE